MFFLQNLQNDCEWAADQYINPRVEPLIKFYFFNLTNPDDFVAGAKPLFHEVGPYAFK